MTFSIRGGCVREYFNPISLSRFQDALCPQDLASQSDKADFGGSRHTDRVGLASIIAGARGMEMGLAISDEICEDPEAARRQLQLGMGVIRQVAPPPPPTSSPPIEKEDTDSNVMLLLWWDWHS